MVFCLFLWVGSLHAQLKPSVNVLFVVDASGSMNGRWQGQSKFALATKSVLLAADSILRQKPAQFALRLFGHQYPRSANNCNDTRLEVPFAANNLGLIEKKLEETTPKGQTMIAKALEQAMNDFPDSLALNTIILVTDGYETCGGDLCQVAEKMARRGIALRPFIVGLGLPPSLARQFECLGSFYDVQQPDQLYQTMSVIVERIINPTTCVVNLLDSYGRPSVTNHELFFFQHGTHRLIYQWMHTLDQQGLPDTLYPDPRYRYDLVVQSVPPVTKQGIELSVGRHNIIAVEVPTGTLELAMTGAASGVRCLVRKSGMNHLLDVQDVNTSRRYLAGNYDLDILTLPRISYRNFSIEDGKIHRIVIPQPGTLQLNPSAPAAASVFSIDKVSPSKVYDFGILRSQKSLSLLPGEYLLVYRPEKGRSAQLTRQITFRIHAGRPTVLRL
ncbi:MAG: VWA domain-containing protein [Chitinophagales bacterium]|nr:VWA domain-containing protein [Chitinophagales bacterium]MDW8427809.1 VWA domain-containing protein [Chitinophagales bacterium]